MALSKKERKELIDAQLRDPNTPANIFVTLLQMRDGKTKRLGRPPKDKPLPVAKELTADDNFWAQVRKLEIEQNGTSTLPEDPATLASYPLPRGVDAPVRKIERGELHKSPERSLQELKELQRQAAIVPGDTEKVTHPDVVPSHLRADIN